MNSSFIHIVLRPVAFIAVFAMVSWFVAQVAAAPLQQAPSGEITVLQTEKTSYVTGNNVSITLVAENDGDERVAYLAVVVITGPSGHIVYDSDIEGEDEKISLWPGESWNISLRWRLPSSADEGTYVVTASLHDWNDPSTIYHEISDEEGFTFRVKHEVILGTVSIHNFGPIDLADIEPAKIPGLSIDVWNKGSGILEWRVTDWPVDWVELISPSPNEAVTGPGIIILKVKRYPKFSALNGGDVRGKITVRSNGGDEDIILAATILGNPDGMITRLKTSSPSGKEIKQGEEVEFRIGVKNVGNVDLEYRVTFTIRYSSGAKVYSSNAEGADLKIYMEPDDDEDDAERHTWRWTIPFTVLGGTYTVEAELRDWNDFVMLFDESSDTFEIKGRPLVLTVSPPSYNFGTIIQGNTPESSFEVSSSGSLEWEVSSWPEWVDLVSPTSSVKSNGDVLIKVKDSAPVGIHSGVIKVVSSIGVETIPLSVSVLRAENTATLTPTAVVMPTPMLVTATLTLQPVPTVTPVLRTSAPTASPALPTVTPMPIPTTPTPQLTNTATPVPPTASPIPTLTAKPTTATLTSAMAAPTRLPPAATKDSEPPTEAGFGLAATPPAHDEPTRAPAPSGGSCSSTFGVTPTLAGLANILFLLAPVAMISARRRWLINQPHLES